MATMLDLAAESKKSWQGLIRYSVHSGDAAARRDETSLADRRYVRGRHKQMVWQSMLT
jgi:hypothetical protein